jgi:hypothetical protein
MTNLSPSLAAGLLLCAIKILDQVAMPAPTASAVLRATGASRTTAYKVAAQIEGALPGLLRPPGRPSAPPPEAAPDTDEIHRQVLTFLFDHPGAVGGTAARRRYSDRFCLFVLDLWETHREIGPDALAAAVGVPAPTLKDWLRGERPQVDAMAVRAVAPDPAPVRIQAVLDAWERWGDKRRGFRAFCEHVAFHLRIPFGHQLISDILSSHGARTPTRRGRAADASLNRGGFETFFPGAQWVGDGAQLAVTLDGERFTVNLELLVDADTGAFTGASIRPTEDATAVVEAFVDGVVTTGAPPIAVLLDNKPSNHADVVVDALGDTLLVRSRPNVPTDKPHIEGAFGLFAQEAPPMVLDTRTRALLAQQIVALIVTTWARAVNHRPRADRDGKSRFQLYQGADITPEQLADARAALAERQRKLRVDQESRRRRLNPVVLAFLDAAFARLDLDDPDGHFRACIAAWPIDAVVEGVAVFEGKRSSGTLPEGVDARYLRGIVRNLAEESEGRHIAVALLKGRLAARDLTLGPLERQRDAIAANSSAASQLVHVYTDHALTARRGIDRTFWLLATADVIAAEPPASHPILLRLAARRIHATFAVPHKERLTATRFLFAKVVPID